MQRKSAAHGRRKLYRWGEQNVVSWLIDQRTKRNRGALAFAFKHHPSIKALAFGPARTRDLVEDFFAGGSHREPSRCIDLAEYADQRGVLIDKCHDYLGLNRAISEGVDN